MARNRVIYQSEALFMSPNATGAHFVATAVLTGLGPTGVNNSKVSPSYNGKPGNKPGLFYLDSSVGLSEDPLVTQTNLDSKLKALYSTFVTDSSIYKEDLGVSDVRNISGELVKAVNTGQIGTNIGKTDGLDGFEIVAIANGEKIQARTEINSAASGTLAIYTGLADFENAYSEYGDIVPTNKEKVPVVGAYIAPFSGGYENVVQQIHRVQSANYSFTVNRTDVNTFGQLARIDSIAIEPPTVNLDFTYYPTDGFNERNLGFYLEGNGKGVGMGTEILNTAKNQLEPDPVGKNFFILTTPESTDAFNTTAAVQDRTVIGLGNGYLSDYTFEAAVGSIPSVSATVELFNATAQAGITGVQAPGVDMEEGTVVSGVKYTIGHPESFRGDDKGRAPSTGYFGSSSYTALKPQDISLSIPDGIEGVTKVSGNGSVHIQNFSLSMPLSRTPIDRLGSRFGFSKVVDLPVTASLSVSALVSELGDDFDLSKLIDDCSEHDIKINLKGSYCGGGTDDALIIDFKGAKLDSESMSSDIGSNKSVDLTFNTQIGGPQDLIHGVFISGANTNTIPASAKIPNR